MPRTQGRIPDRERVNEIVKYYGMAGNLIKADLLMLDVATYNETNAAAMQRRVEVTTRRMNRFAIKWANESTPEAYGVAAKIARASLDILGARKVREFDNEIHSQSIERGSDETAGFLVKANNSIKINIGTYVYLMREAAKDAMQLQAFDLRSEEIIAKLLDETIRAGGTRGELQRLIRIHFKRELYKKKFINISGRNYNLISYAETVARTRLRVIQSEAVKNVCAQYNNDLIEISSHGTDCTYCLDYEGQIYSINGRTPGYETIPEWPPFHPKCEHSAQPTSLAAIATRGEH